MLKESAFGKNDIRGIYGDDVTEELFYYTGRGYISYLSNVYKCLPDMILDMRVNYFFDAIKRTNAINEAATLPFMMYYGMVDGSNKQNQKRLDPMRYDV